MEPASLVDLLKAWIATDTWNASQEFLQANAERLLTDEAIATLNALLKESEDHGEEPVEAVPDPTVLQQHIAIVEGARSNSIDELYAALLKSMQQARLGDRGPHGDEEPGRDP
jgi:hypothetical protein